MTTHELQNGHDGILSLWHFVIVLQRSQKKEKQIQINSQFRNCYNMYNIKNMLHDTVNDP